MVESASNTGHSFKPGMGSPGTIPAQG